LKEIRSIADKIELAEPSDLFTLIDELYKTFESDESGETLEISQQLSKRKTKLDFYKWIFDVSDFNVAYGIRFQGTDIELLSPGKKGIVLLLMYLALDTESSAPLLIDQPEENLDNKSVYAHLIEYFRKAKKRRQIIIITHNPNLVLNTDAEQVIVANFEANPNVYSARLTYISGSIENSFVNKAAGIPLREQGIREHGLDVLEGGKTAFLKRGEKWNLRN
jgi:DNA repair exonuclease SbcCD ATPase subunit